MKCDPADTDRINSFALVSYIPGVLGDFLDRLREELVTGCNPHAHVTILPPRPLENDLQTNSASIEAGLYPFSPFRVEISGIEIFEVSNVVYAGIGRGSNELIEMHEALNTGGLAFQESFRYHPHVTLAQGLDPADTRTVRDLALRRWKESAPAQSFRVETLTFVQNTPTNDWVDLMEYELNEARSGAKPYIL
jgi:2'-5' RNA ligase